MANVVEDGVAVLNAPLERYTTSARTLSGPAMGPEPDFPGDPAPLEHPP